MNPDYALIKDFKKAMEELLEPIDEEEMDEGSFYS